MSQSLGSWPREWFWFGVEAVNTSGKAARGLVLRGVEFHSSTNRAIECSLYPNSAFIRASANSDQISLASSKSCKFSAGRKLMFLLSFLHQVIWLTSSAKQENSDSTGAHYGKVATSIRCPAVKRLFSPGISL